MDCNCNHNIEVYSEPKIKHPPETTVFGYTVYRLSGGKIVSTFEIRSDDEAFS